MGEFGPPGWNWISGHPPSPSGMMLLPLLQCSQPSHNFLATTLTSLSHVVPVMPVVPTVSRPAGPPVSLSLFPSGMAHSSELAPLLTAYLCPVTITGRCFCPITSECHCPVTWCHHTFLLPETPFPQSPCLPVTRVQAIGYNSSSGYSESSR